MSKIAKIKSVGRGLGQLSIGKRISGLVAVLLVLLMGVAGLAIFKMRAIGEEIIALAERDMPLLEVVVGIEVLQLEQSVMFEKALRYAEIMGGNAHAFEQFNLSVSQFEELSHEADALILEGEEVAKGAVADAATAVEREEFTEILHGIEAVETSHATFERHADEVFEILRTVGFSAAVEVTIEEIEAEEEELNKELIAMEHSIEKFTEDALHQAEADEKSALMLIVALSVVSLAIGVSASFIVVRGIVRPVKSITEAMTRLAEGDDKVDVVGTERGDELGAMARAMMELREAVASAFRLGQMVDNMPLNVLTCEPEEFKINYINTTSVNTLRSLQHLLPVSADQLIGQSIDIFHKNPAHQRSILSNPKNLPHKAQIKLGEETLDLTASAVLDKDGTYLGPMLSWSLVTAQIEMANRVSEVVEIVSSASAEMQSTAESMSATAEQTSRQSQAVAAAAEEATTNVQSVAAASEEMAKSIDEIGRQVEQSSAIAGRAVQEADSTNVSMEGLSEAAQKIGEVVELISDIASQTNLLALNATIEAARAGDAGKGFAVVASEVKSLANQTAKATDDISSQITGMQDATRGTVEAIKGISSTINEISEIASAIAAAVEEQGAATQEISRNVQEAAAGTQDVSGNIGGVNSAAAETGQSAGQVLTAAAELSKQGEILREEIRKFLGDSSAAA